MCSFNETKGRTLMVENNRMAFQRYHQRQLSRIYPKVRNNICQILNLDFFVFFNLPTPVVAGFIGVHNAKGPSPRPTACRSPSVSLTTTFGVLTSFSNLIFWFIHLISPFQLFDGKILFSIWAFHICSMSLGNYLNWLLPQKTRKQKVPKLQNS